MGVAEIRAALLAGWLTDPAGRVTVPPGTLPVNENNQLDNLAHYIAVELWAVAAGGGTDHATLTNRAWTASAHTGTASRIAGFDGAGAATYYDPADFAAAAHDHNADYDALGAAAAAYAAAAADLAAHDHDLVYAPIAKGVTNGDTHDHAGGDGAQIPLGSGVTGDLPLANLVQGTARSLLGVAGNAVADYAPIQGTTAYHTIRVNSAGTGLEWGLVDLTAQVTGDLPYTSLAQGSARSVLGVTGNATADVASIQGTADQVLRVNGAGTALAFGAIDLSKAAAVTGDLALANLAPAVTGASFLARAPSSGGDYAEFALGTDCVPGRIDGVLTTFPCTQAARNLIDDLTAPDMITTLGIRHIKPASDVTFSNTTRTPVWSITLAAGEFLNLDGFVRYNIPGANNGQFSFIATSTAGGYVLITPYVSGAVAHHEHTFTTTESVVGFATTGASQFAGMKGFLYGGASGGVVTFRANYNTGSGGTGTVYAQGTSAVATPVS